MLDMCSQPTPGGGTHIGINPHNPDNKPKATTPTTPKPTTDETGGGTHSTPTIAGTTNDAQSPFAGLLGGMVNALLPFGGAACARVSPSSLKDCIDGLHPADPCTLNDPLGLSLTCGTESDEDPVDYLDTAGLDGVSGKVSQSQTAYGIPTLGGATFQLPATDDNGMSLGTDQTSHTPASRPE
jgi:hypothetical protein